MKRGGPLKRITPLKSSGTPMKRSGFKRKEYSPDLYESAHKSPLRAKSGHRKSKPKTDKALLDEIFSKFIRLRDANEHGMVMCVTCQTVLNWKEMDAGHFIPRQHLSTRYDETNVYCQCRSCNRFNGGAPQEMGYHIAVVHGPDQLTVLYEKSKEITKDFPYRELIVLYTQKVKKLSENHKEVQL